MDFTHLHNKFFESYKKRYPTIMRLWQETRKSQDQTKLAEFKFQVHSLKGESGALGFDALFTIVQHIDQYVHAIQTEGFNNALIGKIDNELNSLIAAEKQAQNPLLIHPDKLGSETTEVKAKSKADTTANSESPTSSSEINIALVDDDKASSLVLKELLSSFGFTVEYFTSVGQYESALESEEFQLVLLDVVMPDINESDVFAFADKCLRKGTSVISMSGRDDLETRLMAVRAGVDDYALKPVNINTLITKIRRTFQLDVVRPYKIVLLDDQPFIGDYFQQIASKKGFELTAYSRASDFVSDLDISIPDIFLLDVNMPEVSGIEVAKVLRHETRFEYVPIVFLSADTSLDTKLKILAAGGEDVISKNDSPEQIFAQIEYRISRGQNIRSMAIKDGLTGLLNHAQLMDAMTNCERMALRTESKYAVAILDLDNFKQVNDTYGHSVGDNVIVGLAQLVKRRIRQSDIAGRYGGEEFVVVFQDVKDEQVILKKLNELCKAFASISFEAEHNTFKSSFSCGVTFSDEDKPMNTLMKEADKALYHAKAKGKNCVINYSLVPQ